MAIILKERTTSLTAIVEPSDGKYVIFCPELDLATEGNTPESALDDLVDMALDYAKQYIEQYEIFSKSPNRASHEPYIKAIYTLKEKEKVKALFT